MVAWFADSATKALGSCILNKNQDNLSERSSYYSIFLMGFRWNPEVEMWNPDTANIHQLTAAAIIQHCPTMTPPEQRHLALDEKQLHFGDKHTHLHMQMNLRQAIMVAIQHHYIRFLIEPINANIPTTDLYQGSRLLASLRAQISLIVNNDHVNLASSVFLLSQELKDNPAPSTVDILGFISRLEKYVLTQRLAGRADAEVDYVRKFNIRLRTDRRPHIVAAAKAAFEGFGGHLPNTIASLRWAFVHHLPPLAEADPASSGFSALHTSTKAVFQMLKSFMTAKWQTRSSDRRHVVLFDRLQKESTAYRMDNTKLCTDNTR